MNDRQPNLAPAGRHPQPPRPASAQAFAARPGAAVERLRDRAIPAADAGALEYASWLRLLHQLRA